MCRAFYIRPVKELDDNGKELMFRIVCNYVNNSKQKGNDEGYFLGVDDKAIRTLDWDKYVEFIKENKEAIKNAKFVAGHLRISTNVKGEQYIHGWDFDGFYTYHNGIIETKDDKELHDSFDFFKHVSAAGINEHTIKFELEQRTGGGVFMFANQKKNLAYFGSRGWKINFHLMNNSILVVNSNDDIHKFRKDVFSEIKEYPVGEMVFQKKEFLDMDGNIDLDLKLTYDNAVFKLHNNKITSMFNVKEGESLKWGRGIYYETLKDGKWEKGYVDEKEKDKEAESKWERKQKEKEDRKKKKDDYKYNKGTSKDDLYGKVEPSDKGEQLEKVVAESVAYTNDEREEKLIERAEQRRSSIEDFYRGDKYWW